MNVLSQPLVSVIVPSYNHSQFLRQRLDSIVGQTFQNFELILLDDCSTDESASILKEYSKHPRVSQIIVSEKNSGSPFAQWQKGFQLARGEYIWIAESDDIASLDFLAEMVALLESKENAVLAHCRPVFVDSRGERIWDDFFWSNAIDPQRWLEVHENSGLDEIRDFLRYRNTIPNASGVLFRASFARRTIIPNEYRFAGDWLFWISLLQCGSIIFTPAQLNFFRNHVDSTRSSKSLDREKRRIVEFLSCVEAAGGGFTAKSSICNRDQYWITQTWRSASQAIPLWIIWEKNLSISTRLRFVWHFVLVRFGIKNLACLVGKH
jgi:glycosyltransferase involved in cell wall biosynthesis